MLWNLLEVVRVGGHYWLVDRLRCATGFVKISSLVKSVSPVLDVEEFIPNYSSSCASTLPLPTACNQVTGILPAPPMVVSHPLPLVVMAWDRPS